MMPPAMSGPAAMGPPPWMRPSRAMTSPAESSAPVSGATTSPCCIARSDSSTVSVRG
jgi:hypothetical protein